VTTPNNHGQHRTSDHAGLGAALGGMRDRSSSAASDDEQNRPTLRGRAGIFDVMISQHTRLGLRAQPFSHSRIARRLLPCTGLSNRRADRLLPDRPADLPHAAHEGHIGALSFRLRSLYDGGGYGRLLTSEKLAIDNLSAPEQAGEPTPTPITTSENTKAGRAE